jgi:hypothetical protein
MNAASGFSIDGSLGAVLILDFDTISAAVQPLAAPVIDENAAPARKREAVLLPSRRSDSHIAGSARKIPLPACQAV